MKTIGLAAVELHDSTYVVDGSFRNPAVANQLTTVEVSSLSYIPSMEYDGFSNHPFRVEWGFGDFRLPSAGGKMRFSHPQIGVHQRGVP